MDANEKTIEPKTMKEYTVFVSADQVDVRYLKVDGADEDSEPRDLVEDGDYEETWGFQLRDSYGSIVVRDADGVEAVPSVAIASSGCKINTVDGTAYKVGDGNWLDVKGVIHNAKGTFAVVEDWETGGLLELAVSCEEPFDCSKLEFTVAEQGRFLIAVTYGGNQISIGDSWGPEDEDAGTEPTDSYEYMVVKE